MGTDSDLTLGFGISGVQSSAASDNTDLTQSSQGYVLGLTSIPGGRRTNDVKFQYAYDNRQQTPLNAGAQMDIGDLGTIGGNSSGTLIYRATRYEVVDNYALLLGRHSIRFGVDVNIRPQMQQREANANTNNDRPILCGPAFPVCNTPTSPESVVTGRDTSRQPGFLNWDLRLIKSFKLHENQRIQFSAEGFNISRASNKNFGTNEESKFGKPQATMNPNTGFYYSNHAAGITTSSPATNRAGGPRQMQLGARYQF